jgi:hypothetical protein
MKYVSPTRAGTYQFSLLKIQEAKFIHLNFKASIECDS